MVPALPNVCSSYRIDSSPILGRKCFLIANRSDSQRMEVLDAVFVTLPASFDGRTLLLELPNPDRITRRSKVIHINSYLLLCRMFVTHVDLLDLNRLSILGILSIVAVAALVWDMHCSRTQEHHAGWAAPVLACPSAFKGHRWWKIQQNPLIFE